MPLKAKLRRGCAAQLSQSLDEVGHVHERHPEYFFMLIYEDVAAIGVRLYIFSGLAESAIGRLSFERPHGVVFSTGVCVFPLLDHFPRWARRLLGRFAGDFRNIPSILRRRVVSGFFARLWVVVVALPLR